MWKKQQEVEHLCVETLEMPKEKKRTIKFLRKGGKEGHDGGSNIRRTHDRKKLKKENDMTVEKVEGVIPLKNKVDEVNTTTR